MFQKNKKKLKMIRKKKMDNSKVGKIAKNEQK